MVRQKIYQKLSEIKEEEKEGLPHHLFDIKNIDEDYSIYDYQKDLRNVLSHNKDKINLTEALNYQKR